MATEKSSVWSGFWARVFAWIIDTIVLGVVCYGVGSLAPDYAASLGSNGRFFGLGVGVLYFGLTASGLFGGRSIGMRCTRLKVVRLDGRPLGLATAFGRALLLIVPLLLNGWFFDVKDSTLAEAIGIVDFTLVFGVGLAQIYLLLFNAPTRRLVHDLVFGSVVVRAGAGEVPAQKGGIHASVAGLIVLAVFGMSLAGLGMIKASLPQLKAFVAPEQRVRDAVNQLPEVSDTAVGDMATTTYVGSQPPRTTHTLTVTAHVRKWPVDVKQEEARIGAKAVKAYSFAPGQQLIVSIAFGWDLGLASYTTAQSDTYSTTCATADVKCLGQ